VLLQHPFVRHEASEALGPVLLQADPDLALTACSALAQLGSSRSLEWLVSALTSDDRPLRMEARAALMRLTGLDLPADPIAWGRAIQG
jgi:HEAT repeat protein